MYYKYPAPKLHNSDDTVDTEHYAFDGYQPDHRSLIQKRHLNTFYDISNLPENTENEVFYDTTSIPITAEDTTLQDTEYLDQNTEIPVYISEDTPLISDDFAEILDDFVEISDEDYEADTTTVKIGNFFKNQTYSPQLLNLILPDECDF